MTSIRFRTGWLMIAAPVLVIALGCGASDDITGLSEARLEVVAFTSGVSSNSGDYQVRVDSGPSDSLAHGGVLTLNGLSAGRHTVQLLGVDPPCVITGQNPMTVDLKPGITTRIAFGVNCQFGSIRVTMTTSGASLDSDGYVVTVDSNPGQPVGINDTILLSGLPYGGHVVQLGGMASNCSVAGSSRLIASVNGLGTWPIAFQVSCLSTTAGFIEVTATTLGIARDPDGYGVALDSGPLEPLGPNSRLSFTDLTPGPHSLAISGVAPNCLLSGSNPQAIAAPAGIVTRIALTINCGPAGRILFDGNQTGTTHVYAMDGSGANVVDLTPNGLGSGGKWSPDGTRIVFWSERTGNDEIYVMNADGSNPLNLTNSSGGEFSPEWSPDGSQIAFGASGGIYVMNADGSGRKLVIPSGYSPAWSPDGTRIVFVRGNGVCSFFGCGTDLYRANADGSSITNLTHNNTLDVYQGPAWSPDGSLIGYRNAARFLGPPPGIMVMNPDGSGRRELFNGSIRTGPIWSPDGNAIATAVYVGNNLEIMVHEVSASSAGTFYLSNNSTDDVPTSWK